MRMMSVHIFDKWTCTKGFINNMSIIIYQMSIDYISKTPDSALSIIAIILRAFPKNSLKKINCKWMLFVHVNEPEFRILLDLYVSHRVCTHFKIFILVMTVLYYTHSGS